MPDPLFDRPLIAMVELRLEVVGALVPHVSLGVAKQYVTSLFLEPVSPLTAGVQSDCGAWSAFFVLHIVALHPELANLSCRLNLFLSASAAFSFIAGVPKVCAYFLLSAPSRLGCEVARPPFPPRLLARSNDASYAQVVLRSTHVNRFVCRCVLPGGSRDSSRKAIIVFV